MRPPDHVEIIARGWLRLAGRTLVCFNRGEDELAAVPERGPLPPRCYGYLPGGHVEPGESAAAALAREFMEEARLRVRVGGLLAVYENVFEAGRVHHEVLLVFHVELARRATVGEGEPPRIASAEPGLSFHWVDDRRLLRLDIRPRPLSAAMLGRRRPLASGGRSGRPGGAAGEGRKGGSGGQGGQGGQGGAIWLSDIPRGRKPGRG